MTFRERLKKEHPKFANEEFVAGCKGCPSDYGYEQESAHCQIATCRECWDREIPADTFVLRVMLDNGAVMPKRAHPTDAGLDLCSREDAVIPPHGSVAFDTGVHVGFPAGYYGKLESKSGLNVKYGVVSLGGVIDENYTGSIVAKLYNMTDEPYTVKKGDKVVQMVVQAYAAPKIELVTELEDTDRGEKGFGSTGR